MEFSVGSTPLGGLFKGGRSMARRPVYSTRGAGRVPVDLNCESSSSFALSCALSDVSWTVSASRSILFRFLLVGGLFRGSRQPSWQVSCFQVVFVGLGCAASCKLGLVPSCFGLYMLSLSTASVILAECVDSSVGSTSVGGLFRGGSSYGKKACVLHTRCGALAC